MPIMEVVLEQSFVNQQIINRFNYLASGTPAAVSFSFGLIAALGSIPTATVYPADGMMAKIAECQSSGVAFVQIGAKDVYSVSDFYETPFVDPLAGVISTGNSMSPTQALGFRTNRTRLDIRRGTKRFVGLNEGVVSSGGNLEASYLAGAVSDLEDALGEVLTYDDEGQELTYTPIIVGKEKVALPGTDPVRYSYRYYETQTEQLDHIMQSLIWEAYTVARTQNSRQYGRGR